MVGRSFLLGVCPTVRAAFLPATVISLCALIASCGGDEFGGSPPSGQDGGSTGGTGGTTPDASTGGATSQGGSAGTVSQGGSGGGVPEAGPDSSSSITVQGKVVDPYMLPVAQVQVRIGTTTTTTDDKGDFVIDGVNVPYEADMVATSASKKFGYSFAKVTRKDPTFQLPGLPAVPSMTATLSGAVQSPSASSKGIVFVDLPNATPAGKNTVDVPVLATTANLPANWYGDSPTDANVNILLWTEGTNKLPQHYDGWQSIPVKLSNGSPQNISLAPKAAGNMNATLSATVSVSDPDFVVGSKALFVGSPKGRMWARILTDLTSAGTFAYSTPAIQGLTFVLCGTIKHKNSLGVFNYTTQCKTGLASDAVGVALVPELPPATKTPVTGQIDITLQSEFSWSPVANAVYVVSLTNVSGPSFFMITSETSAKIPDLKDLGDPLVSGTSFSYTVFALAPNADMDAATGPKGFFSGVTAYADQRGPDTDSMAGVSALATITAQ